MFNFQKDQASLVTSAKKALVVETQGQIVLKVEVLTIKTVFQISFHNLNVLIIVL